MKIPSFDGLEERLKMYLEQYNESIRGAGMDLVFFRDAMIHLMRVSDIACLLLLPHAVVLTNLRHHIVGFPKVRGMLNFLLKSVSFLFRISRGFENV